MSHNPFLASYKGKNETEKVTYSVLSSHSCLPQGFKIVFSEWQKCPSIAQLSTVAYICFKSTKTLYLYTRWIFNHFPETPILVTKNSNWDSILRILSHSKHAAQYFKYCELVLSNKFIWQEQVNVCEHSSNHRQKQLSHTIHYELLSCNTYTGTG